MPGPLAQIWRTFYHDTIRCWVLRFCPVYSIMPVGHVVCALFAGSKFLGYQLLTPSWSRYGNVFFFLGTDDLSRDVLSRLLAGTVPTFGSALVDLARSGLVDFTRVAFGGADSCAGYRAVYPLAAVGHCGGGVSRPPFGTCLVGDLANESGAPSNCCTESASKPKRLYTPTHTS